MSYQETLDWMFSQLPMYQREGKSAYKADLSNTIALMNHLNHPYKNFKSIHVAGTNGKGSTSHMLASVLQEAGYRVGLYTSPHLKDFRERIKINGKLVPELFVVEFIKNNKAYFESYKLSFFEMTVGMAFEFFSQEQVDIAIIEVGMGGRLDSTNVITPEVSVITNIGMDHKQFLGDTLEAIAYEKGGIIKPMVPVVIGETHKETKPVFDILSTKHNCKIIYADVEVQNSYDSDLKGEYQFKNIKTVIQTIREIDGKSFTVSEEALKRGLLSVVQNTGLLGRWHILNEQPKVICDVGHNREGLTYVMSQLQNEEFIDLHIVFGVVNDKDVNSIINLLPNKAKYYLCKPNISRGMDANKLKLILDSYGFTNVVYDSVAQAYKTALKSASKNDLIFVGGSTFVVAEII